MTKEQIKNFIAIQLKVDENTEATKRIINVIEKPENKDYRAFLSNPLLLSMFIFTFNSYPELPRSKSRFYWNVFDTLCSKHDSFTKKGCWQHERKSNLQNEELEKIIKWFSYFSFFNGKLSFDSSYMIEKINSIKNSLGYKSEINDIVYDLTVSIPIIIIDGIYYTFPHKSLQEYFAAILIKGLPIEQKVKVYSEQLNSLFGESSNFYNLCYENDFLYFIDLFLLKNLKDFYAKIDFSSNKEIMRTFFEYINFSQGFRKDKDTNEYKFSSFSHNASAFESIVEYLSIFRFFDLHLNANISFRKRANEKINMLIEKGIVKKFENDDVDS